MPLPPPFDGFVEHTKRVSPTCLIHLERNRYSVPALLRQPAGQRARLSGADRRRRGRADPLRASADHRALASSAGADGLRLAPLSGGDPAQAGRLAQRRALRRICPRPSSACRAVCSSVPAVTGKWWRSWPWFSSTTSRPCCAPSSWRWTAGAADQDPYPEPAAPAGRRQDADGPPPSTRRRRWSLSQEPRADVERYDALRGGAGQREARHAS